MEQIEVVKRQRKLGGIDWLACHAIRIKGRLKPMPTGTEWMYFGSTRQCVQYLAMRGFDVPEWVRTDCTETRKKKEAVACR